VLAALGGLAQHWADDARARSVINLAERHTDTELRAVVATTGKKR
jgi:hypothetical protein